MLTFALAVDYDKIAAQHGRTFLWTTWKYYPPYQYFYCYVADIVLQAVAGPYPEQAAASAA